MRSSPEGDMDRWSATRAVWLICGAALLLRVGFVLTRPAELEFPDSVAYDAIARNLLAGRGFVLGPESLDRASDRQGVDRRLGDDPDAFAAGVRRGARAPGYPLFLAGSYALFGRQFMAVRLIQAVIGVAACALIYALGARLFGERAGMIACAISAVYPFFIFYTGLLLSETLFIFALLVVFLLLRKSWAQAEDMRGNEPTTAVAVWGVPFLCGIAFGLAVLIRSSFLLYLPFLLPFWLGIARSRGRMLAHYGAIAAGVLLALMPWMIRNYRIFGRVVVTTLQVGESLYEGNSPYADGGPAMDRINWELELGGRRLNEYENDRHFRQKALEYMRRNPGRIARLAAVKLGRFWNPVPNYSAYRRPFYLAVSALSFGPVVLSALIGMFLARREWRKILFLLSPVLYYSLLHMVFVGSTRYRTPIMPMLIILAGFGLHRLTAKGKNG